jgi:hypothetical protein
MKTAQQDITTTDPEDTAAVEAWAARRAAAAAQLAAAQAELASLQTALAQPDAAAQLAAVTAARTATGTADGAATDAHSRATAAADAAARYAATDVAQAQATLDARTHDLAELLAQLLRDATTTSALTATIDGLALRQRYAAAVASTPPSWDHTTIPFLASGAVPVDEQLRLPVVGAADYTALLGVLQRLDETVDALADLVTAESVHQLVGGNLVRSGAALDIAASGSVLDTFDVITTRQTGTPVDHRVLLLTDAAATPAWAVPAGAASLADPLLNSWLTTLLPVPGAVGITVSHVDDTGASSPPLSITLAELGLDPVGMLRCAADSGELTARIALVARRHWVTAAPAIALTGRVVVADGATAIRLGDVLAAAETARALVGASRAVRSEDFVTPSGGVVAIPATVATDVTARVRAVEAAARALATALDAAASGTDPLAVAAALLRAVGWAVPGATPQLTQALPPLATLQAQAQQAAAEVRRRLASSPFAPVAGDPGATLASARTRLATLVGWSVPVLVKLPAPTGTAWAPLGAGPALTGATPAAVRAWVDTYARVRPALEALLSSHDVAQALRTTAALDLRAVQLGASDAAWHGQDAAAPHGVTNIVVARSYRSTPSVVAGLAVDAWTQRTPSRTHQAAVAFHYDEPDSTPPQVALVAVAPDVSAGRTPTTWDLETLLDTLLATLAMSRQRAVAAEVAAPNGIALRGAP